MVDQFEKLHPWSPFDFTRAGSFRSGQALAPLAKTRGIGMTLYRTMAKLTY
jgi:hypothetical protein